MPNRPRPRPKTQRIVNEDAAGLKSSVGSIRRRISFREMSSTKRQSSVNRNCRSPFAFALGIGDYSDRCLDDIWANPIDI